MSSLLLSAQPQHLSHASVEVVRCSIMDDVYCLEMSVVLGVKPARDLRPHHGEPNGVVGVFDHRGEEIPIYDLCHLLGTSQPPQQAGQYVVLIDHPVQKYGLRVDSVSRVIRLERKNVLPLPKTLEHVGRTFRGILDFTRERKHSEDELVAQHLPGLSEPRQSHDFRRRSRHQMQLLLNPATLLADSEASRAPAIPAESLLKRYASTMSFSLPGLGRQMVVFPVGTFEEKQVAIGLSISQVVEITEPLMMVSIPGAHPSVLGFVHWRTCPVPVVQMQTALACQPTGAALTHLVILRDHHNGGLLAFPVEGRIQSLRLPIEHRPCALPDASWRPFVIGAFEFEDRVLILPRLNAIGGAIPWATSA